MAFSEIKPKVTIVDGKMLGNQSQQTLRNIMVQCEIRQIQGLCDIYDAWVANASYSNSCFGHKHRIADIRYIIHDTVGDLLKV